MTENTRNYEAIYILPGSLDDQAVNEVIGKHSKLIQDHGGAVEKAEIWERRRLAYPIGSHSDGVYCLIHFASGPNVPAELSRIFRISDEVVRGRVFKREA